MSMHTLIKKTPKVLKTLQFDFRGDPDAPSVKEYQALTGCSDIEAFKFGEHLMYLAYVQKNGEPLADLTW